MNKHKTIADIRELLMNEELSASELEQLKADSRVGVQQLLHKYEMRKKKQLEQKQSFQDMLIYEQQQYKQGKTLIAGVDEVGRGPLAGPVVAAAVILDKEFYLPGLNDSKQLTKKTRESFFSIISEQAVSIGVGIIHSEEIDRLNIYQATKKAMKSAIQQLNTVPDHVLIDAVPLENMPCTTESMTKGDQKSVSIAAASIVAKVTRDRLMEEIHASYPVYNFSQNSGYGTREHLEAIKKHGITQYHRRSFAPVKEFE